MRAAALLVLVASALTGCSGVGSFMRVRQDKEDQAFFGRELERVATGERFAARDLIEPRWTRLFVVAGGGSTDDLEKRIGIPFPESGDPLPQGSYLVFDDGEKVVAAFSYAGPAGATGRCLRTPGSPLTPETPLEEVRPRGGGSTELSTVAAATRC